MNDNLHNRPTATTLKEVKGVALNDGRHKCMQPYDLLSLGIHGPQLKVELVVPDKGSESLEIIHSAETLSNSWNLVGS